MSDDIGLTDDELEAIRYALWDYLESWTNPMIKGPEPEDDTKERLRNMSRALIRLTDTERVPLMMGDWSETVTVDGVHDGLHPPDVSLPEDGDE